MLHQLAALLGALMILGAYAAYQRDWLGREDVAYNLLNLVGSSLLAWVAVIDRRWGFILLEVAWALLSLGPLARALRARGRAAPSRSHDP